jgi:hypothetical protein
VSVVGTGWWFTKYFKYVQYPNGIISTSTSRKSKYKFLFSFDDEDVVFGGGGGGGGGGVTEYINTSPRLTLVA